MQSVLFVAINIAIAAAIGGLTNFLAIRMLFYPRKAWFIMGKRVPFTPGLIPKRREELAVSLGKVVGQYLITSEGLRRTLLSPAFAGKVTERLEGWLRRLAAREGTIRDWAVERWGEERAAAWETWLGGRLDDWLRRGLRHAWIDRRWKDRTLGELLSSPEAAVPDQWMDRAAGAVVSALQEELRSERGDRLIRSMVVRFFRESGGLLGTIAGMFVNEEQVSRKIRSLALSALESEETRGEIREMIRSKVREWERMTLAALVEALAGPDGFRRLEEAAAERLGRWAPERRLLELRWSELLNDRSLGWIVGRLPHVVERGLELAGDEMDRMVAAFNLPELVRRQVSSFPVERVEQIVLSVSGREFRAITWLGAVLGGMIGLVQSLMLLAING